MNDYRLGSTAGEVLQSLYIELIAEAKARIPAVLANNDNEELHKYRVALRKMRSILEEFKSCMDPDIHTLLKQEIKEMVSPTNTLRDMDVFLENIAEYRQMMAPQFDTAFTHISERLREERDKNFETIKRFVKSSEYVNMLSVITDLTQTGKFYSICSRNDIKTVVERNMYRRLQQIIKSSKKLGKKSKATAFHRQRIAVKKLRYMLDTFAHLFPETQYRRVAKSLKSLQDCLGHHQDLTIQIERLSRGFEDEAGTPIILAVLEKEQKKSRKAALQKLEKLSREKFQNRFKKLFAEPR